MRLAPATAAALCVAFILSSCALCAEPAPDSPYRSWLLELGAVPLEDGSRVRKPSINDVVHGWVNPRHALSKYYVPVEVQEEYGLPKDALSYERYVSFLRVDEYAKEKSPELYAAMLFSLEQMLCRNIPVRDSQDIIRVYEAGIGLEEQAVSLLERATLAREEALALFERFEDVRLIHLLTPPEQDGPYMETLQAWSNKDGFDVYGRFLFKRLLAEAAPRRFQTDLRDFVIQNVASVKEIHGGRRPGWWERLQMYRTLIAIGDEQSWDALNEGLVSDPITETREQILLALRKHPQSVSRVMDAVLTMTEDTRTGHTAVTPSRMAAGYEYDLAEYLKWARSVPNLNEATRDKIRKASENLRRNPLTAGSIPPIEDAP
jgi:hypothetical protein